jgi:tetratricopeptide (TPR) repeat protein
MLTKSTTTVAKSIALLFLCSPLAADVVVKRDGSRINRVSITKATHEEVEYRISRIDILQRLPGEEVQEIEYSRGKLLQTAKRMVLQQSWEKAFESYERAQRNPRLAEPGAFGIAWTLYRQHIETGEKGQEAVGQLRKYLGEYAPKKGFHVPRAIFLLGNAYVAVGSLVKASEQYDRLANFDGDSRRLLAVLGKGRVILTRCEPERASQLFKSVVRRAKWSDVPQIYRRAVVWRGRSFIAEGDARSAVALLEDHLEDPPEGAREGDRFLAQASNVLGDAYAVSEDTQSQWEALYRYLRTTVEFRKWRNECAEAFYKAGRLAQELGVEKDAHRLFVLLRSMYGGSVWARKLRQENAT